MCGRFARYAPLSDWLGPLEADTALLEAVSARDDGPRYNIAPGTRCWTAALDTAGRLTCEPRKWSFPTSRGNRINIRFETAHVVPEYKEPFGKHRCVVFASGFYEPRGEKGGNRPWYFFRHEDEAPLFLGAVAQPEGFSILTRKPVAPVTAIHGRGPVLVPSNNVLDWLDPDRDGREALSTFAPPEYGTHLGCWRVSDAVKRPRNEGPALIEQHQSDKD
jgi:putative SOS response-associated peptidase YedK